MNDDHDFCVGDLRVLLHHYSTPGPFPEKSEMVRRAYERLSQTGLLERDLQAHARFVHFGDDEDRGAWEVTEKGRAHVEALLNLPLPEQVWVTPGARP